MYIIVVYDVAEKRVAKVCHFLRQYLNWIQNSVFEGELTTSEFERIREGLKEIINMEEDSIIFYILRSEKILKKSYMGRKKAETNSVI